MIKKLLSWLFKGQLEWACELASRHASRDAYMKGWEAGYKEASKDFQAKADRLNTRAQVYYTQYKKLAQMVRFNEDLEHMGLLPKKHTLRIPPVMDVKVDVEVKGGSTT